ncbi:MAG: DUF1446 domain-containing protein [Alphaproteobacteria bacterium]|nr:DUF1446 domain-containing protein [Alphaproteobacteria bacterium]
MSGKTVRLGGASAFWGDSSLGAPQLVHGAEIDYLVFDYLAELTMSIMAAARARRPDAGYATDFVAITMKQLVRDIKAKGIKVVSNAGGVNPLACRDALQRVAEEAGVSLKVGVVLGDDLMARQAEFRAAGTHEMYSDAAFPDKLMSINAYLGARGIAAALAEGCEVVITGRVVDSAVTLGPLMHEFGWADDDFDRLAAGTLCGHIIECGAQCTGGLFTDWERVASWENIGYPVAEVSADGSFVIGKPRGTDGLVCFGSVAEQLLYEIQDPSAYLVPDVACDFTAVQMREMGENRVLVSGARGRPPTSTYKVSATYQDGLRNVATLVIGGIDADRKARRTGQTILARTRRMFQQRNLADYSETRLEVLGSEDMYGSNSRLAGPREVVLRIAVKHPEKEALEIFAREFAPAGTSMAPGTTGLGGRPSPTPIVRLFSFLVEKADVPVELDIEGNRRPVAIRTAGGFPGSASAEVRAVAALPPEGATVNLPLVRLAYGRSGDKGDTANIGIIARQPECLPLLRWWLTPERVKAYFAHLCRGPVERFDLPGLGAMNFLLHRSLGGGGMASLHSDNLAKAYAQMLLDLEVPVPKAVAQRLVAA